MKKNIIKAVIAVILIIGAVVGFNLEANAKIHEPIYDTQCYNNTGNCWFWNCHTVTHCGNCSLVSADEWYEQDRCSRTYSY